MSDDFRVTTRVRKTVLTAGARMLSDHPEEHPRHAMWAAMSQMMKREAVKAVVSPEVYEVAAEYIKASESLGAPSTGEDTGEHPVGAQIGAQSDSEASEGMAVPYGDLNARARADQARAEEHWPCLHSKDEVCLAPGGKCEQTCSAGHGEGWASTYG